MSSELLKTLSKEYSDVLESGKFSDTEILVGEEPNTKVFKTHSLILKIRSPYFCIALSDNWIKTENNVIKLRKPNISVEVFDILIKYIYSGTIDLTKYDTRMKVALLIAADELCLNDLCLCIEEELLKDETLLKNNFVLISNVVNKFNQFTKLSQFYKVNFQQNPSLILRANDFATIQQETLLNFLSENGQSLKHIEVWDKLIEWAIAQPYELPTDTMKWTSSEITTFGTIIQPFIQHINFKEINPAYFYQKIKPFKNIFGDKFYAEILEYYSFNDDIHSKFKINIDSKIISSDHAFVLGNFIKIMKQDSINTFYNFNLLVRGSRDGFNFKTFHECCDKKGPTITVACVKNTNEILGGFNPLDWDEQYKTNQSFIFSLDKNKLTNFIFSKVVDVQKAICSSSCRGPDFGASDSDLRLLDSNAKTGQCYKNSYERLIRQNEGKFEIDDYEVFQVRPGKENF